MGGITGIVRTGTAIEEAERAFIGVGQPLQVVAEGGGWALSARARSTLAVSDHYVVALAGHFDRAPGTGQSAAQILLDTWEKYGIDALMRVEGTWVAAVYDRRQQRLHLLRDPFGIRRLFFVQKGGKIAFSTQARSLLELPWVSRELARENLSEFLSFRYVHAPRTLLRDVQALPAGHHAEFRGNNLDLRPWYSLKYSPPYARMPDDQANLEELERRMNRSVAARASGKERVGVFLSGGLDSSAITALASRLGKVHTFTVGVQDADDDEVPYAGRVANLLHTQHEVVRVSPVTYQESFERIVAGFDFPVTDPAAIPQYLLAKAAKNSVDVILAGDGGDEIFGGRMVGTVAAQLRLSTLLTKMPGPARRLAAGVFGKQRPELNEPTIPVGLARRIGGLQIFDREARATLIRDPGWVRPGIRRSCLEPFYREVVSDPINEILHAWLRGRMAEDALARSGAAAALSGLALREPLLDRDLVSFCSGLPGSWKVRNGGPSGAVTKWPLREMLRPILGRALVNRPKRVLPGPWRRWFEGPLKDFKDEQAARLRQDQLRLFLPGAVDNLLARMAEPGTDVKVWTLIFLDAWLREIRAI